MNTITLTKIYNPLNRSDQDHCSYEYLPGQTLADLVSSSDALKLAERESLRLSVSVNGLQIAEEQWPNTTLMPGQEIVVIPVLCGGGGGGGSKSIIRMVAMIIIMVVASAFLGPAGTLLMAAMNGTVIGGGGILLAAGLAFGVVGIGIMVGGYMLLNALLPMPMSKPPSAALGSYQSIDQSNSYSWQPKSTQQQGIAIPWYYGTCKITGNIIGSYREMVGTDQYTNALISLGRGILSPPYDFRINAQEFANYKGIDIHTRLGHLDQQVIPFFGDTRLEYPLSMKVINGSPVTYTTIGSAFDALEVQVVFPSGLYYYNDQGGMSAYTVNFKVEYKKADAAQWSLLTETASSFRPATYPYGYWSAGHFIGGSSLWYEIDTDGFDRTSHYIGGYYDAVNTWRWMTGTETIVVSTQQYQTATGATQGAIRYNYKAINLAAGNYDIRVTNLSADITSSRYGDDLYLAAVVEILQDDFTYPGQALVGLRALGTDQLSGSFSFDCMTDGKLCRVYDGSAWSVTATSNPAWICFDILTQPVFDANLNVLEYIAHGPGNLDTARWFEWAQYCDDLVPDDNGGTEPRLTYNGAFDATGNMWDAALSVSKIGRATPYWRGTTITVAIDKPSDPVALISVGNIGLDSFEEVFLSMESRAGSIEADFLNIEKNLDRDKYTVINPDAPAEWGSTSLSMMGVIKPSEVWRHCRYYLATTQCLTRVVTIQMDIDSIAFTIGDVINVQHDVPMWGEGGRIVSGDTTIIVLDKEITIEVNKYYSLMIRLLNGTIATRTVVNNVGTSNTVTLSVPLETAPDPFDVYAFGETETVVKPMRVSSIEPAGDFKRKIVMTDYNESVYNADMMEPVLQTQNFTPTELPAITGLSLSEHLIKERTGAITSMLDVVWQPIQNSLVKSVELFLDGRSYGIYSATTTSVSIPAVDLGSYQVQVRSVGWLGDVQDLSGAATASYTIQGKALPPGAPTGLSVLVLDRWLRAAWTIPSDADLAGFKVKVARAVWGADSEIANGVDVFDLGAVDSFLFSPNQSGTLTFMIKSFDTTGNFSGLTQASKPITAPSFAGGSELTTKIIDNNVLMYWPTAISNDYPIEHYEIRRGIDYSTATVIGNKSGTFTSIFETVGGTYKYWIAAVDTAGLLSVPISTYATVSQPPDYALQSTLRLDPDWGGTLSNCVIQFDGSLACLVNTSETWQQHFVNNSFDQPSDQISAGYTVYGQPGDTPGYYEETVDYGAAIASTRVTMDVTRIVVCGSVTIIPTISVKLDIGDIWTDYADVYQAFVTNFRYIKYRLDFSSSDNGILKISGMQVKLEMKQKSYEGTVACLSTDSGGTTVDITGVFIDVSSIQITPLGTSAVIGIYDFIDTPYPTSFKILLFDSSGTRISGTASYLLKGA